MIETELRALLADRAEEVTDDNAARVTQVHDRIDGIRRRRTAGTALALVSVVAAGVLLTRVPGTPDALPTGAPAGPYFAAGATSEPVDGYRGRQYFSFTGDATWSVADQGPGTVVVARGAQRGDLALRNAAGSGPELRLSCRVPVGDHWEGALPLDPAQAGPLFAATGTGGTVAVRPGSPGRWTVGLLQPLYPSDLAPALLAGALLNGIDHPDGGRLVLTIPGTVAQARGFGLSVVCVRGVQLEFRVDGRLLTAVACTDDADPGPGGLVTAPVPERTLTELGLRPLQRVAVDVRPTGRRAGPWAVVGAG